MSRTTRMERTPPIVPADGNHPGRPAEGRQSEEAGRWEPDTAGTIFTIGHGASPFHDVLEVLRDHRVATLIDVRTQPYSRHAPDFTRHRLEDLCSAAGLGYRWMGAALGGRPADPALPAPDGMPDRAAMAADPGVSAALETVAAVAEGGRVALLCAEEIPDRCHRSTVLAPLLADRGHRIVHLRHDGSATPHQQPLDLG